MAATDITYERVADERRGFALSGITRASRFYWIRLLIENKSALVSIVVLLIVVALAVIVPIASPYGAKTVDPLNRLEAPSHAHWMGTDDLGRDVLTRIFYGARVSLFVGVSIMVVTAVVGSALGLIAAYYQRLDSVIMRVMDGLMAFPSILLAIAIMASLGPKTGNVIAALSVVYTPLIARLVRGTALATKQQPFVESARAIGARDHLILRRYIFPNSLSPLIVQCTFIVAAAILSEASLSFLGAGVPPEIPTWGNMLRIGQREIFKDHWLLIFPSILLFLSILALNILGDGLRDALDPRSHDR
jgi:peptide/nickel transport system permease protein